MKKQMILAAALLALTAAPAMAEDTAGKEGKGVFAKHDVNSDGVVTKDEFLTHAETKFKEIDKDADGKITKDESEAHRAEWKEKHKEKREEMREKIKDKMEDSESHKSSDSE